MGAAKRDYELTVVSGGRQVASREPVTAAITTTLGALRVFNRHTGGTPANKGRRVRGWWEMTRDGVTVGYLRPLNEANKKKE
jgi:hypothetical protein